MSSQSFQDIKDKFFVIYLDILAFGISKEEIAKEIFSTPDRIRRVWLDDVRKVLKSAKKRRLIRSFRNISGLDSWVAFSEAPNNVYQLLDFFSSQTLQFEIAIDFHDFPKKSDAIRTDEMMAILKNDIIANYREYKKSQNSVIRRTFILATDKAYLGLGTDICWRRPYLEAKYYLFITDEDKDERYNLGNHKAFKKVIELESRIAAKPIFGRENDIAEACSHLNNHSLAIIGMKGIGKSKVASAVFENLIEKQLFGTYYWRRLAYDAPPSFAAFARRFVKDLTGEDIDIDTMALRDQVQFVVRVMKDKRCLLVIDQFEALIQKETRRLKDRGFAELLTHANEGLDNARMLITAWELPVDSRGVSFPVMLLKGIDTVSGMKLMKDLTGIEAIQESHKNVLEELVSKLAGHPFALSAISGRSINEIKQMLNDRSLGEWTIMDIAAYIVSEEYERLPDNLKSVLSSGCIFPKAFNIEGISFVSNISASNAFQALADLRQRGLVIELQEGKYDLHLLVREFVSGRLHEVKKFLHERAAKFYASQPCISPKERTSIDDARLFLEAIDHLMCAEKYEHAASLFLEQELDEQLYCWSHFMELVHIYNGFVEQNIPKSLLGTFLGNLGLVYRDLGELKKAKDCYERALAIAEDCQDKISKCTQFVNLGDVHHFIGNYDQSIEYHNQAKGLLAEIKEERLLDQIKILKLEGRNTGCLGNAFQGKGDSQKAREYYEQAVVISQQAADRRYEGVWLGDLGNLWAHERNFSKAIENYNEAYRIAKQTGDRRHESWWLGVLGNTHAQQGSFDEAIDYLQRALSISERIVFRRGLSYQLHELGNVYFSTGKFLDAVKWYEKSALIHREMEDKTRNQERLDLWNIGNAYFAYGDYAKSISYYDKVLKLDSYVKDRAGEISHLLDLGDRYLELRQFAAAITHYNHAFDINKEYGDRRAEVLILDRLEKANLKSGQYESALEMFTKARNIISEEAISFIEQFRKGIESFENELNSARSSGDRKQAMIALSNLGGIYFRLGQNEKAINHYTRGLNISKELAELQSESDLLNKLGEISISLAQFEEAKRYYKNAIVIAHDLGNSESECRYRNQLCEVYLAEADHFLEKGQAEIALEKCSAALKIDPNYAQTHIKMGNIYVDLSGRKCNESLRKAIECYSKAVKIQPTNSSAYAGRADCRALSGDLEKAISDYEMAFKLDPSNTSAILSKMEVQIWLGRYSDARSTYGKWHNSLLSQRDRIASAWLICTALALDGMRYDEYMEPLRDYSVPVLDGGWCTSDIGPYFEKLAKEAFPSGRLEKALEIHELFKKHFKTPKEIIEKMQTDIDEVLKIGPILFESEVQVASGDFQKSLERCNEAIALAPNTAGPYALRARIYKTSRRPENYLDLAIQDYTKAIELEPGNGSIFHERANCYAYKDAGKLDESLLDKALSDYRVSVELDPGNVRAILSKMEVEIWLGRYTNASDTYRSYRLSRIVMSPQHRLFSSWLVCLALCLDGMPYEDYLCPLKDNLVVMSEEDYNPEDIKPYLAKLRSSNIDKNRIEEALKIHDLFLKHYKVV